jgi:uncharacterized membrane protein
MLLLFSLPALSPRGYEVAPWRPVYNMITVVVVGMMCGIHILILAIGLGAKLDVPRVMIGFTLLGLGLIGNMLGKVKRNFWAGVRTPWTLASEKVWTATHRLAARLMFGAGVLGAVAVLVGLPVWIVFWLVIVATIYPVLYSYLVYRKLEA